MGDHPTFKPFRASFLKGAQIGICVSDPKDAVDDVMIWHGEAATLLAQAIEVLTKQVLQPAERHGEAEIASAAQLAMTLLSVSQRQIESAGGALDAVYAQLPDIPFAREDADQPEPPLRRAVRSLRAEQRVNEALAVVRQRVSASAREV